MKKSLFTLTAIALFSLPATAADCDRLPKWLNVKSVTIRVVEPTQRYDVKFTFPDVSRLDCSASYLEYGTDYHFDLDRPVKLEYPGRSTEMSGHLTAHSVMLAAERERTPHYYEVEDEELGVTYHIYLGKGGPAFAKRAGSTQVLKVIRSN